MDELVVLPAVGTVGLAALIIVNPLFNVVLPAVGTVGLAAVVT